MFSPSSRQILRCGGVTSVTNARCCALIAACRLDVQTGYYNVTTSTWGGLPIQDPATGTWHLFVAEMMDQCGLWSWKNNSRIVRAESTSQNGPFAFAQEVVPPFAHNPKVIRAPDGTYLVYFIGGWQTQPASCAPGEAVPLHARWHRQTARVTVDAGGYPGPTNDTCGPEPPLNGGCGLAVASSSSLYGPWTVSPIQIVNQNASSLLDCAHTNPAPLFFPNGSMVMLVNAGFCHNDVETIGMLQAPSWRGPYTLRNVNPIFNNADGSLNVCEDPTLWIDARGWHAMVHNFDSRIALYAHSLAGGNWTLHSEPSNPGPYDGNVLWLNGSVTSLDLQRPQLTFDPARPSRPLYLINGAIVDETSGRSFTLFRPLRLA